MSGAVNMLASLPVSSTQASNASQSQSSQGSKDTSFSDIMSKTEGSTGGEQNKQNAVENGQNGEADAGNITDAKKDAAVNPEDAIANLAAAIVMQNIIAPVEENESLPEIKDAALLAGAGEGVEGSDGSDSLVMLGAASNETIPAANSIEQGAQTVRQPEEVLADDARQVSEFDTQKKEIPLIKPERHTEVEPEQIQQNAEKPEKDAKPQYDQINNTDGNEKTEVHTLKATENTGAESGKDTDNSKAGEDAAFLLEKAENIRTAGTVQVKVAEKMDAQSPKFTENLADKISEGIKSGAKEIEIQLSPENLGKITIKFTAEAGRTLVNIVCDSIRSAELLSRNVSSLASIVEANTGTQTHVSVESESLLKDMNDGQGQERGSGQEGNQKQKDEREVDFIYSLKKEMFVRDLTEEFA